MVVRHGKAVLIKFGYSGAFVNHVNDFLRVNHERDTSFKALALTKIQSQSYTTQEMRIIFVPSFVLTRFK